MCFVSCLQIIPCLVEPLDSFFCHTKCHLLPSRLFRYFLIIIPQSRNPFPALSISNLLPARVFHRQGQAFAYADAVAARLAPQDAVRYKVLSFETNSTGSRSVSVLATFSSPNSCISYRKNLSHKLLGGFIGYDPE